MQSPIEIGTILQNRYRLIHVLGQGGFGRTYLAEDLGRFNERCALKEFVPQPGVDHFSDKATQLFQREAAILYQIQHPQIPQFRATFEQDQRLFLVQDYVDGTTYRDLLDQRRQQGMVFSEAEVRQFLKQMLPVLAHIHAKGIIHRDISPDNIIRRRHDQLPLLIDFGVVKEVVTRIQFAERPTQATTVGKLGYAPSEQMQSGRAYPSSDLYSLAVTAVVLLTGREPQDMFDDVNLNWTWQSYAQVSPGLAQVLNKAMSYRPGDRYQSVSEMAQALGAVGRPGTAPAARSAQPPATAPSPNVSHMKTVAVGRPYEQTAVTSARTHQHSPRTQPAAEADTSIWENPWAVTAIGLGLALIAGLGGWAVVSTLNRNPQPAATDTPSPTLDAGASTTTPSPTTSPTDTEPVEYSQRLGLSSGDSRTIRGSLRDNETITYQLAAEQGQRLTARLQGEGVLMTVLAPNGEPADNQASRVLGWQGELAFSGQYGIQLRLVQGLQDSDYSLQVSLEAPESTPEPTPTPTATPEPTQAPPEVLEQRVQFPSGQSGMRVANSVGPQRVRRYVVNAREGQILSAELSGVSGPVTLNIRLPGGQLVEDAAKVLAWQGQLPRGGDYLIDVVSPEAAEFTLSISVTD
ncbi:Serine-threonine-protein kinase [Halomicronema hongdechloris C2206]|uniref:non-specific serine/threonine protein kinase n=1 Tax=Halomicronema hongdechloris C2206 TaxID=1641165 RepID=A0A1Z3HIL3_9CYAN|nr:serine/threonine-protein kinase [Halomicronema hongdechloris]ASC70138.1 Serine-threonine-protein kinase [Halomicronema hongdechloris C2206]